MDEFALRNKIEESKADYSHRYGSLDWQWKDEGLPWAIMDYHSSKGSVIDFSEDDWMACKENGFSLEEVLSLCGESYLAHSDLKEYVEAAIEDWNERTGESGASGENIPKQDMLAYIEDFYIWREEILPKVSAIYESENDQKNSDCG